MDLEEYPQEWQYDTDEPSPPPPDNWRTRLERFRTPALRALLFVAGVAAAFIAVVLYQALFPPPRPLTTSDVNTSIAQAFASVTPQPAYSERVYQIIQPSLVLVQSDSPGTNGTTEHSIGSGVIINDQGDILTALHVVTQSTSIEVTFADGTKSSAQVTTSQPENDIAVLHADQQPAQIVPATLGNPGAMRVGDEAYAVGNPFGLYSSISSGVISAFGRSFKPVGSENELKNLIQIDAAVNPGNSGGALVNRDGELIGIVTALINPTEDDVFIGIGLAVPIDVAGGVAGLPPQ